MLPAIVLAALIASGMLLSKRDEVSAAPEAASQSQLNRYADPGMTAAARLMDQRSARAADAKKDARAPTTVYSPLRGKQVPVEEMNLQLQPFYRGAAPGPIIDRETARVPDPKVETTLGAPIREYKVSDEEALNRETYGIAAGLSATRQGELLMTPQREQKPRAEHTARALPPNIDELRGSAKPRYVDAGRIIPGSAPIPARQTTPNFAKRTPEAFKTTTAADFLPTSAPAARQGDRPTQVIPNTARGVGATNYLSHAAGGGNLWSGAGGDLTHNPRFSPAALPIGTAGRAGAWDVGADISELQFRGDLRDNERDLQQGHGAALPMIGVKAGPGASYVSPERERTDWNMKTLSTGAPRVYGNMRGATALKQTMYDPNMVARTTLKETMIHDTTTGIAGPRADRGQARNTDVPDATIRNTLEPVDSNANLAPISTKAVVYDPDDLFEPTHRDTLGDAGRTGNVDTTPEGQGYMTAEVEAQNTQRQFQHREYTGIADRENGDAYRTTDATAPQTQREFVGNTGPSFGPGGAANTKKSMSYADIYAARFTGIKESILQGRAPTTVGPKVVKGSQDPDLRLACNRDPYMEAANRPTGFVARQGASQEQVRPAVCQDARTQNRVDGRNSRHDGTETSALRANPFAIDITRPPAERLPAEATFSSYAGDGYVGRLGAGVHASADVGYTSQIAHAKARMRAQGLPHRMCADPASACLITRNDEHPDVCTR